MDNTEKPATQGTQDEHTLSENEMYLRTFVTSF
jgi:hypothetical protein